MGTQSKFKGKQGTRSDSTEDEVEDENVPSPLTPPFTQVPTTPRKHAKGEDPGDYVDISIRVPSRVALRSQLSLVITPTPERTRTGDSNEEPESPTSPTSVRSQSISVQKSELVDNGSTSQTRRPVAGGHGFTGTFGQDVITPAPSLRIPAPRFEVIDSPSTSEARRQTSAAAHATAPELPYTTSHARIPRFLQQDDPVYPRIEGQIHPEDPLPMEPVPPKKYYVVWKGLKLGVFYDKWVNVAPICKDNIIGGSWGLATNYHDARKKYDDEPNKRVLRRNM